jgi:hypothetical protein
MRKLLACGLAAALVWGLASGGIRAGDDDAEDSDARPAPRPFIRWSPVFARMVAIDTTSSPEKPAAKDNKAARAKDDIKKSTKTETPAARARSREEMALIRRLEVCDKLMEVAIRTEDRELENRVYELQARAQAVYARNAAAIENKIRPDTADKSADGRKAAPPSTGSLGLVAKLTKRSSDGQTSAGEGNP